MKRFSHFPRLLFILALALAWSGTAQAWWNPDWTIRKKITLDTTSQGGAITDPIGTGYVLVRLHDGDFQFSSARDDGSDIRFIAADDKTPLAWHIEKYDSLLGEAFVWVKVPDLKSGASTSFWLYYGNTGDKPAPGGADAKATYDADTVLVYHFADKNGVPPQDISGSSNNAQNAGLTTDSSLIGPGLRFDGKTTVTIPASSSFAWSDGGALTLSAWIKPAALAANNVIFSRRDGGSDFLVGLDNGIPFVEINGNRSSAGAPVAAGGWHHLAVVSEAGKTTLYLDGVAYATLGAAVPALNSVATIGGDSQGSPFLGEVDELEIFRAARPPGFIKFSALEQNGDANSKVLSIAQDEQPPAGWFSGALGTYGMILKSVTIDGWVVIGVLAVMGVVCWYIMVTKFLFLRRVAAGNREFLKEWHHVASDLTVLDQGDADQVKTLGGRLNPAALRVIRYASLYRIYHIGAQEIRHRLPSNRTSRILSAQSIQAIRASLDGEYVRQTQRLNAGLVFLTISIAGGPFVGLLGTVTGVMVTFGTIGATGSVDISAIAPGLAAALVATEAGLLVAIPALLGYNYLVSVLRNISSDMQIFNDEVVTKLAEFYSIGAVDGPPVIDIDNFTERFLDRLVDLHQQRNGQAPEPETASTSPGHR